MSLDCRERQEQDERCFRWINRLAQVNPFGLLDLAADRFGLLLACGVVGLRVDDMRLAFQLIALSMLQALNIVQADTWQRAEIYFIDWNVSTRVSLSPERVREVAEAKIMVHTNVADFVNTLDLQKLKKVADAHPEDARLVIDLFTDSGKRVTYYASYFNLCTADNALKRSIDDHFRDRFRQLAKQSSLSQPIRSRQPTR